MKVSDFVLFIDYCKAQGQIGKGEAAKFISTALSYDVDKTLDWVHNYWECTSPGKRIYKEYVQEVPIIWDRLRHSPLRIKAVYSLYKEGEEEMPYMLEVRQALEDGQKLMAVKLYAQATGVGLKEAKDFIEQLQ